MKNKLSVTAIILCHINDDRLLKALESVQFCDEILILDHQSHNDWEKLAQKFHFRVIQHQANIEDFSQVRNSLAPQAQHDWILSLDSDEYLADPALAAELLAQLIKDENFNCASVTRTDIFAQQQLKHGEAGQQKITKIYDRRQLHYKRPVHEEITGLKEQKIACLALPITILHHSHLSVESFFQDVCQYAEMEALHRAVLFEFKEKQILFQLIFYPLGKFVLNYFFKLGCLDGFAGLVYASLMSLHSLMVRIFLWENLFSEKSQTKKIGEGQSD